VASEFFEHPESEDRPYRCMVQHVQSDQPRIEIAVIKGNKSD
jgi:hypothetical protein